MWPEPPWAPLRDSAWLGDLEPASHVCYLTAAPTTVCRFMCRIRSQAKGFRVSGVKFWEAAVVIGLKLCKRFGFSVFMKSAVIEVEGACQCDLGRSPVPPSSQIPVWTCDGHQGGSLHEAMSPTPLGEGELGPGGHVGPHLFSSVSTVPQTRKRPSSQVTRRDRLSECPPSAIWEEGLCSDLSPRPGRSEQRN